MTNNVMYALIVLIMAINVRAIYNLLGVVTTVMTLIEKQDEDKAELNLQRAKRLKNTAMESAISITIGSVVMFILFLFTQGG